MCVVRREGPRPADVDAAEAVTHGLPWFRHVEGGRSRRARVDGAGTTADPRQALRPAPRADEAGT
eukprot:6027033-Pyramimonas_sp.AAC.1